MKKIFFIALVSASTFFTACGDDSSSTSAKGTSDLPTSDEPVENETNTEDEKTEGGETSSEGEATTAKMVSCMLNVTMSMGGMEFSSKSCTEVAEGDAYVATLNAECIDASSEADGMAVNQKAEIGSACEEGYKVKCTGSAGNTVYLYDEDAVDCEGVK